jgi:hypothetical protein
LYRLRVLLERDAVESELDEELQLHFDHEAARLERQGMAPDVARRRARVALARSPKPERRTLSTLPKAPKQLHQVFWRLRLERQGSIVSRVMKRQPPCV